MLTLKLYYYLIEGLQHEGEELKKSIISGVVSYAVLKRHALFLL